MATASRSVPVSSMTGFGQGEARVEGGRVTVEVKSVNHRYLDLAVKGPREYASLEPRLLEIARGRVKRGKVDVFVTRRPDASDPSSVRPDLTLARGIHRALTAIAADLGLPGEVRVETLAAWREVIALGSGAADVESDRKALESALAAALDRLTVMRAQEGERLVADVTARIGELRTLTAAAKARAPRVVEEHRAKLQERLQRLLGENAAPDPARLAQEIALLADRVDVHEEIVRLESHLEQLESTVAQGGELGRRLDFLLQEVGRETNTLGSKANDAELARIVVDLKAVAERIREQAQNLE